MTPLEFMRGLMVLLWLVAGGALITLITGTPGYWRLIGTMLALVTLMCFLLLVSIVVTALRLAS